MGTRGQSGFTILETTLFLAITGLLILGIITGTGASLNTQRYRDAVETFKSTMQEQYAKLSSTENTRNDNWSCDSSSTAVQGGPSTRSRGQSDCMLVGSYVRIQGNNMAIYPVLASRIDNGGGNDITAMASDYSYNVAQSGIDQRKLEWGTEIAWARTGTLDQNGARTPRSLGVLFVRSPISGQVYTFTSNNVPPTTSISPLTFTNMIVAGASVPGQGERMICIDSGGMFISASSGVYLAPFASGSTAVETRTNDTQANRDRNIQC